MLNKIKIYLLPTILLFSVYFAKPNDISSFKLNDIAYFSVEEFCSIEDCNIIYYEDKSKLAVIFDNIKITFSSNLSFAQVDNKTINLLNGMLIHDDKFFIQANSFLNRDLDSLCMTYLNAGSVGVSSSCFNFINCYS